jgi:hypothetical protein
MLNLLCEVAEFGKGLSHGPNRWAQAPALLNGDPHGIHPFQSNVSPSLPAALTPAQVPIRAVENPTCAATARLTAAPPLPLEAADLRQVIERHRLLDAREGHRLLGLKM